MLEIIYGTTRLDRQQTSLLRAAIEGSSVSGCLYFGYPVLSSAEARQPLDVLLVSPECGVVGLLLLALPPAPNDGTAWEVVAEEQNGLYAALETQLGRHPSLRQGRKRMVEPDAVTILPAGTSAPVNAPGEFVPIDQLANRLRNSHNSIQDNTVFKRVRSIMEHVSAIKPVKRREKVQQPNSMGAKLKRIEQSIAILDRWQKQAAIETPDGAQRIRGLAGSGKTVVLALKAAYLHAQEPDWRIAVVFYTQSLYQQFQDLVRRFCFEHLQSEPDWSRIKLLHAWGSNYQEGFYFSIAESVGLPTRNWVSAETQFGRNKAFEGCCSELLAAITGSGSPSPKLFDAVLIDEAQDLPSSFFQLVYAVTASPKRIVWAYDELQQLSAESVPGASDLFGRDTQGNPLITLERQTEDARRDITLPLCYRNPPWTLTVAHGLGFGTARKTKGLVQHFDEPALWDEVGYEAVSGSLELGVDVKLRRKPDSFPDFFAAEFTDDLDNVVDVRCFAADHEQFSWVAQSIQQHLAKDELEHDDFLIVLPDEYTAKSRASLMMSALAQHGIRAHHAGVHTARNVVFQDDSIPPCQ
jgi:superfamily I DNA and RNA helicase